MYAGALFLYIAGLSMFARGEARNEAGGKPWLAACLAAGVIAAGIAGSSVFPVPLVLFCWWLSPVVFRREVSVGTKVARLLAGIPLLDLIVVTHLVHGGWSVAVAFGFLAAFGTGLLLQRLAAAT